MKKKILLFVLAFAMIFTSLVSVAHAEEEGGDESGDTWQCLCPVHNPEYNGEASTCEGVARRINIAKYATFTETSTDGWQLKAGLPLLNDGNWHTGALSNPKHAPAANNYFEMHFADPNNVTEIVFVVNSTGQGSYDGNSVWNELTNNGYTLTVKLYNGTEQVGETVTISAKDIQTYSITPNSQITKITVQNNSAYTTVNVLWEVEVWSQEISHIWELVNTDTAATCTVDGVGDYACACGATNDDQPIPATGHTAGTEWFIEPASGSDPEKHYNKCVNTGCTEKMNMAAHNYSSECDLTCNTCAATREATGTHSFEFAECQTICDNCDFVRTDAPVAHTYDHDCDAECNSCEEERETEHVYTDCEDTECNSQNADGTIKCGATRTAPGHTWDNACDNECNACGAANPDYAAGHFYDNCDDTVCNECEFTRTAVAHIYDNCDDTGCNTCGMTRTAVAHVYDNACDGTCNNCTVTRTPADHVYDNACDATCNVCSAARTPAAHAYDNDCDKTCNVCSAERTVADHVYGEEFEESEAGTKVYTCSICGYKNDSGEKTGLGGGAIAGIVIGSVAVVGGGGFAAWWFIFKKKAI